MAEIVHDAFSKTEEEEETQPVTPRVARAIAHVSKKCYFTLRTDASVAVEVSPQEAEKIFRQLEVNSPRRYINTRFGVEPDTVFFY